MYFAHLRLWTAIHPFAHTVCSCGEEGRERKQEGRDKMKTVEVGKWNKK